MSEENKAKKKQTPSPWNKEDFIAAMWLNRGNKQSWKEFYDKMRLAALEDTKGVYEPTPNAIRLRCLNVNKRLANGKEKLKQIPIPEYVSANPKERSTEEILKDLMSLDASIKEVK